jgi:hypothetical protein
MNAGTVFGRFSGLRIILNTVVTDGRLADAQIAQLVRAQKMLHANAIANSGPAP